jgi:hypothetical protein
MPDLMDELRAIAPSHEIPEWATKVAAGGREESAQPTVVRGVDNLRRSERAPGARRRTAWTLGLAAVVALIALVAATVWWAPWQPKTATPASVPNAMQTAADQKPAAVTARRQASGYIVQSPSMTSAALCEAWMPNLTMDKGGCINTVITLTGIDWSTIPWAKTGTDGTRAAGATVQGTLQGENIAVDAVLNKMQPTPAPSVAPSLCDVTPVAGTKASDASVINWNFVDGFQATWPSRATSDSIGVLNIAVTSDYVSSTRAFVTKSGYSGAFCVGTVAGPSMMDINNMQRALTTVTIPYFAGIGQVPLLAAPQVGPLPRVNLRVTIRVPEQDQQIAAVYGPDWATYVFVDPVFTLVL